MLPDDKGEKAEPERIGLSLQHAEFVLTNVRILRRKNHETAFRQPRRKSLVDRERTTIAPDCVVGPALQPVLADHDGTPLPRFQVLRQEERTVNKNVGIKIEHDLVAAPGRFVVSTAGSGIGRIGRRWQASDNFIPKIIAVRPGRLDEALERGRIGSRPEPLARDFRFPNQMLRKIVELVELTAQPRQRIGNRAQILQSLGWRTGSDLKPGRLHEGAKGSFR